jgi:demethylmenaquinone methyltransferase / 2-methoxy-6-polyprenyl-1,4-benzoquinol methylase
VKRVVGTTPPGVSGEKQAADWVQNTFAEIAPRYDLLNHLLSFNIDRGWRKALLRRLGDKLQQPDARILDLCCGTGDVLLDLQSAAKSRIIGADFCHPMLTAARQKAHSRRATALLVEADALRLPMADGSFDAISIAFGFRNLTNYRGGLQELARVLKPGGVLAILEFSHPPGMFMRTAYGLYSRFILPAVGRIVSGSREAYAYLPESIRKFPPAEELKRMVSEAGFSESSYELLTGGVAALHIGRKSTAGAH